MNNFRNLQNYSKSISTLAVYAVVISMFVSITTSNVYAAPKDPRYDSAQDCTKFKDKKSGIDGYKCCWREPIPGSILGQTYCQTCEGYPSTKCGDKERSMALAEQTDTVNASKTVNVSKNILWEIISDPDRNPDYWPITIIENINKSNNTLERKVIVPAPPFMDNKAHQIITIDPSRFIVIENQTQGAVTGIKNISLVQRGYNTNLTQINVVWNLDLSKIPVIGQGFAKNGISNSVVTALEKITNTAIKQ